MSPEAIVQKAIGVILTVEGEVMLKSDQGLRVADHGSSVFRSDELITGADGRVEIRFIDDTLLSQGAESSILLDDYIYEEADESAAGLLFKMSHGTFRVVTGKIAERNPERFELGSPLATIGIRGTVTVHEIGADGEKHGVEAIHSGKALLIQSIDGTLRQISSPRALVDIASSGQMSTVRTMTVAEFEQFRTIAPAAIEQEQYIEEEQDQDQNQDQDQMDGDDPPGGGDIEGGDGAGAEGEPLGGEGVLSSGDGVLSGVEGVEPVVLAVAEQVFEALNEGDVAAATELLEVLAGEGETDNPDDTEDVIDELFEADPPVQEVADSTSTAVDDGNDTTEETSSSGDGINWGDATENADHWTGTDATDYYDGLGGDDEIDGKEGNDTLKGGDGNDTIYGYTGDDSIEGGAGNDLIYGEAGRDVFDGGDGDDYIHALQDGDTLIGSTGIDTVSYAHVTDYGVNANLETGVASGGTYDDSLSGIENLVGTDNDDVLVGNDGANVLSGLAGADSISGGLGNDRIYGDAGRDVLDGGAGDDYIYALQDGDTIIGSTGNDTVSYVNLSGRGITASLATGVVSGGMYDDSLSGIENLVGSGGSDVLVGDGSANSLIGMAGSDSISGGAGDDYLEGGSGADILDGGSGQDTFHFDEVEGLAGEQLQNFSSADDTIDFDSNSFSETAVFLAVIGSYAGTDAALSNGPAFVFDADGKLWYDSNGVDAGGHALITTVTGDAVVSSDLTVDGVAIEGTGIEWIYGDNVLGETWSGTSKTDYYDGRGGDDSISGKQGVDTLLGGLGNDVIDGGNGDDSIDGGGGNDTIYGGQNVDNINGGSGDDLIFGGQNGDTMDGGEGNDTVSYEGGSAVQVDLAAGTVAGGSNTDILISIENVIGTDNSDVIKGCSASNSLTGGAGDDTLYGSGGADYLSGGAGRDVFSYVSASEGGDTITGFSSVDDGFSFSSTNFSSSFTFAVVTPGVGVAYDGQTGPADGSAYFVFDSDNGQLWYDPDGSTDSVNHTLIATVLGDNVVAGDIFVESGGMA